MLTETLETMGAVCIRGPRGCGKTTSAMQICKSSVCMEEPAASRQNLQMAGIDPFRLLKGDTPRLIDEWQPAPSLWNAVRIEADNRGEFGQFIMTDSAEPRPGDLPYSTPALAGYAE
ncbi:MAG: AAA family ATPase [Clostridia bacterium]|nr:AAA family ATPase [Clostridia bacterium]